MSLGANRVMGRTTGRVLRTELLRGTAPVAALALAVTGLVLLFTDPMPWAGRWGPLAEHLRVLLLVLGPLATTVGAWQAGRERRRRVDGLIGTVARPPWQQIVMVWSAVTAGTFAGYLMAWLAGAAMVAPVASYGGRGWWWTLAGGFAGLAAMSALGVVVGRLVPLRVVAPIAGMAAYVLLAWPHYGNGGSVWLFPSFSTSSRGVEYLGTDFQLLQIVWLAVVTATLLMLVAVRRKSLLVLPAVAAVVAAVPIATGPGDDRWQEDPAARELVCTSAGQAGEVCLARVNAFYLDDVAAVTGPRLDQWGELTASFRDDTGSLTLYEYGMTPADEAAASYLSLQDLLTVRGGLPEGRESEQRILTDVVVAVAGVNWDGCAADVSETAWDAASAAQEWAMANMGAQAHPAYSYEEESGEYVRDSGRHIESPLLAMSQAEQESWMKRYLNAAQSCDEVLLVELREELR